MTANFKRVPLAERLRIAKAVHAEAVERAKSAPPPTAEALRAAAKAIEKSPLHVCGVRMSLCATCAQWVCRAPGHPLHVCQGSEFSQVEP